MQKHQATVEATRKLEVTEQEIAAMNEKIVVKKAKRAAEELARQAVKEGPENSQQGKYKIYPHSFVYSNLHLL